MDPRATAGIDAARGVVDDIVSRDAVVYGINTGFGKLAQTRIAHDRLAELQRNLVRSHATGVGAPLAEGVVRLVLATKAVSLARGHSGVRAGLVDALVALVNAGVSPRIPQKGSVGASGDLAPLAHLAAVLIGEGEAIVDGVTVSGAEALRRAGIAPFVLGPKEGLALLNGTQVSTALALAALFDAEKAFAAALVAGALSLEAIRGSVRPLDARIHAARGQRGQIAVAAGLRALLADSGIVESHAQCGRVQDPYSIRCMPQVMGACLDNLRTRRARARNRGQRGVRQSARVRCKRRSAVGRQLPRRAGGVRRRRARARDRRDRRHRRAAHCAPDRRVAVGPAAVPRRARAASTPGS